VQCRRGFENGLSGLAGPLRLSVVAYNHLNGGAWAVKQNPPLLFPINGGQGGVSG